MGKHGLNRTKEEIARLNNIRSSNRYYETFGPSKPKKEKIKKNFLRIEMKRQEEITRLWKLYGVFQEPDMKKIEKEVEIEEKLFEDTIDEVDIKDCELEEEEQNIIIENDEENNYDR